MVTQEQQATETSPVEEFIRRLEQLDVGARARLRRSAGRRIEEARGVMGLFYRLLPHGVPANQQDAYFLIATLYPIAESGNNDNFGVTLRTARSTSNSAGIDRRVEVLLDSDADQLTFRLRQAVQFAKSNRVAVNWKQLLRDILQWSHPQRFVQRKWAETYFGNIERNKQ